MQGRTINERVKEFCDQNPSMCRFCDNLGQIAYLSCLKNFDLMIGNSSSGITEAPSFKLPVVNIGDRQKGRIKAPNVIDVGYSVRDIQKGIELAVSDSFRARVREVKNPYDKYRDGSVSHRIKETLKSIKLSEQLLKKRFHDLDLKGLV
jgi:UDP-N-acetylglucosamine 2-epimerase (non-hydrolysing)/GDP/UDP-N,N'-diacetylbacillosamine 2-epimerase (hydrolysing)